MFLFNTPWNFQNILRFSENFKGHYFFDDRCLYHAETSLLIYSANRWTGFYMIGISVMKKLNGNNWRKRVKNITKGYLQCLQNYLTYYNCPINFMDDYLFLPFYHWRCSVEVLFNLKVSGKFSNDTNLQDETILNLRQKQKITIKKIKKILKGFRLLHSKFSSFRILSIFLEVLYLSSDLLLPVGTHT